VDRWFAFAGKQAQVARARRRATLRRVSQGYQKRDRAVVDYQLWQAWPGGDFLRGPQPSELRAGSYVACVGAAQTFGCLVQRPWPALLAERAGMPTLNLGVAGAGPRLFRQSPFRELIAGARAVVFQVTSGRSADCSRFRSGGRERLQLPDGRVLGADAAWSEALHQDLRGLRNPLLRGIVNRLAATFARGDVKRLVDETRADWVTEFCALLDETRGKKLLLWFSRRAPDHTARFHSLAAMFGDYPQLVDRRMVASVRDRADAYVECVTRRGSPERLVDRTTGRDVAVRPADAGTGEDPGATWTHNAYYPSQAMHEDAAAATWAQLEALL
jgi:Domain of unknown function (DUF6473)